VDEGQREGLGFMQRRKLAAVIRESRTERPRAGLGKEKGRGSTGESEGGGPGQHADQSQH
jgi:hypothetical protein